MEQFADLKKDILMDNALDWKKFKILVTVCCSYMVRRPPLIRTEDAMRPASSKDFYVTLLMGSPSNLQYEMIDSCYRSEYCNQDSHPSADYYPNQDSTVLL